MIENLKRFIAYICPDCSGITDTKISLFDFSGKAEIHLSCADKICTGEAGAICMKGDKVKLIMKCPVCGETHTYSISTNAFWSKELITFECANSGVTIFFAGEEKAVMSAVDEAEKMFDLMETDADLLTDELRLVLQTLDALHIVMDEKRLICKCGSRNMFPVFENDEMYVECEDCKNRFPIVPSAELLKLLSDSENDLKL